MILTESWLTSVIPDEAVQPQGFSLFLTDRSAEYTGKNQGTGVYCLINNNWCMEVQVLSQHCSPSLE